MNNLFLIFFGIEWSNINSYIAKLEYYCLLNTNAGNSSPKYNTLKDEYAPFIPKLAKFLLDNQEKDFRIFATNSEHEILDNQRLCKVLSTFVEQLQNGKCIIGDITIDNSHTEEKYTIKIQSRICGNTPEITLIKLLRLVFENEIGIFLRDNIERSTLLPDCIFSSLSDLISTNLTTDNYVRSTLKFPASRLEDEDIYSLFKEAENIAYFISSERHYKIIQSLQNILDKCSVSNKKETVIGILTQVMLCYRSPEGSVTDLMDLMENYKKILDPLSYDKIKLVSPQLLTTLGLSNIIEKCGGEYYNVGYDYFADFLTCTNNIASNSVTYKLHEKILKLRCDVAKLCKVSAPIEDLDKLIQATAIESFVESIKGENTFSNYLIAQKIILCPPLKGKDIDPCISNQIVEIQELIKQAYPVFAILVFLKYHIECIFNFIAYLFHLLIDCVKNSNFANQYSLISNKND